MSPAAGAAAAAAPAPAGLVVPAGRQGPGRVSSAALETLDLTFGRRVGGATAGEQRGYGVGVGTELAQLRPYEPGDDLRQLDPAASARTAVAHVRQHVPERTATTWLVLDLSASMAFGSAVRLKSDVAQGVCSVVARLAVRRGGRVGALTCGAPVARLLPPRSGRRAAVAVERVAAEGVAPDGWRRPGALDGALLQLRRLARQPGMVVVVSDFRDTPDWERTLRVASLRQTVVAVEVFDPRERALPDAGALVLVDPESGRQVDVDTGSGGLRARFEEAEARRRGAVAGALRRAGAVHISLSTAGDWLRELARSLR